MAEERPRRLSLLERSSKPEVPKFKNPPVLNPAASAPPRKRVSFAESEDVRVFEVEREPVETTGFWFSSLIARPIDENSPSPEPGQTPVDQAGTSSGAAAATATTTTTTTEVGKSQSSPKGKDNKGKNWKAEHGQEVDEEWSQISMAAQKKVHEARRKSRASIRRPSAIGEALVPAGCAMPPVIPKVAEPKKIKKKKRKKKKKEKKKKKKKMSVMAFLRGPVKRSSKAKVERALKKMMRRIVTRVKKKHDKMQADKELDMAKIRRHFRKGRKKKKLYTVKRIRGRNLGLKSLLKQWKWVFIFS